MTASNGGGERLRLLQDPCIVRLRREKKHRRPHEWGLEILVAACRLDIPGALDPRRVRSKPFVAIPPLANSYAERRGGGRLKNKVIAIVSSRITRKPLVFRAANPVRKVSSFAAEKPWLSGEP